MRDRNARGMPDQTAAAPTPVTSVLPTVDCGASAPERSGAALIARGVQRMFRAENVESVVEMVLASGRRADVLAVAPDGSICIVEIKSSVADFRADHKWQDYQEFCDTFYFAVAADFPIEILPNDVGLILADGYGAARVRHPEPHPLSGARRKALLVRFGRCAAMRLSALLDPMGRGITDAG